MERVKPLALGTLFHAVTLAWLAASCANVQEPSEPDRAADPAPRPNVLFIAVDDLRPDLGCYGVEHAQSPHIDAFASTAALFEHHYVQAPSCGPSRAALLTGRSPATSGRLANSCLYEGENPLRRDSESGAQTMPELFRRAGYHTVCIGKISHTPDGRVYAYSGEGEGAPELPHAWDELDTPVGPWGRAWGAFFAYAGGEHREDGTGRRDLMEFEVMGDRALPDGLMAEAAAAKLAELKGRDEPFFLGVGFFKPHLPFVAPTADQEAFLSVDVTPAEGTPLPRPYGSKSGEFRSYRAPFSTELPLGDAAALETRRAYLACVRYVDRQVGVVLKALENEGLAESTIVVLWGDHGWHLGESDVWGKHTLSDRALHSPLLVRVPGVTQPAQRIQGLAATLDLYPTLVELCRVTDLPLAEPLEGVSLVPLLNGTRSSVRASVSSYWGKAASVRTLEHRYFAHRGEGGAWGAFHVSEQPDGPFAPLLELPESVRAAL